MATNYVQDGNVLDLTIPDVTSGSPVVVGNIVGVALTDTDSDGNVRVATTGVWNLSVKAVDGAGDSAVSVGDYIYYVTGETPYLSKENSGKLFGVALGSVAAGQTATIPVKLGR